MSLGNIISTFVAYATYALIPYIILAIAYRVTLHPLAKYPGPFLAKLTDGYAGLQALARRTHTNIWLNHAKYGQCLQKGDSCTRDKMLKRAQKRFRFFSTLLLLFKVISVIPFDNFYHVPDPPADIYQNPRVTKSHLYVASRLRGNPSIFSTFDRELHRQKRQIMGQSIND
ncbi:cytochrome P450 4A5 [Apiospora aurea]|uniref:Cytochrome P450 4A5 n=1 Tax=Apiospora aurea TaxID=335848 RepID=A0ABR1QXV9_9PEZI